MSQWVKILVPQRGIESHSLPFEVSVITARPLRHHYIHPSKEKESMSSRFTFLAQRSHWPPISQWVKILVPQWGIEPQSLAFRVSIITARPPRHRYTSIMNDRVFFFIKEEKNSSLNAQISRYETRLSSFHISILIFLLEHPLFSKLFC